MAGCERCGGTGSIPTIVRYFPQIDSRPCLDCRPDHRLCIGCGNSSPGNNCPTCDARRASQDTREGAEQ